MVAKRAKQLINGAKKLLDVDAENPLTVAIQEVNSGKVGYELMNDINLYLDETEIQDSEEGEVEEVGEEPEVEVAENAEEKVIENSKEEEPVKE